MTYYDTKFLKQNKKVNYKKFYKYNERTMRSLKKQEIAYKTIQKLLYARIIHLPIL